MKKTNSRDLEPKDDRCVRAFNNTIKDDISYQPSCRKDINTVLYKWDNYDNDMVELMMNIYD